MARLAGLSSFGGTIKISTTFAYHFNQFGGEHSILRDVDRHYVIGSTQSTAARVGLATGVCDRKTQTFQVLNSIFESHH
jgi:hypothetical protein